MLNYIEIEGGVPLQGKVQIGGAKNAALPMLLASLLTSEPCKFTRVPNLQDVNLTLNLLEHFGAEVDYLGNTVDVSVSRLAATEASLSLVKALRASFWILGPLLARGKAARVALPGGDIIGARPVDMHLEALGKMGADIKVKHGVVYATAANGLRPAEIQFRFPSVGATHQVLMAAALTPGLTTIEGAAREPEVVALAEMLTLMGASIEGAGTSQVKIEGQKELKGTSVDLIGDRIEAGTYLLAAAATHGQIEVLGVDPLHFGRFLNILEDMGVEISTTNNSVSIVAKKGLRGVRVSTGPFPEFATDLQAPLMAALSLAKGMSYIEENVFEGRFGHVSELCRMGAQIHVAERLVTVEGRPKLTAAPVDALDIRAGAAVVIAALASEGVSKIHEIHHLRRGYENLEQKFSSLGARISCKLSDAEDYVFTGC